MARILLAGEVTDLPRLREQLEAEGHVIHAAPTVQAAVAHVGEVQPDLVVVDAAAEPAALGRLAAAAGEASASMSVALAELQRATDELSNLIAHELRNPLSVIVSSLDFMAEVLEGADPSALEALHDAQGAGRRMLRILANLQDVSRLEANRLQLKRQPTSLERLVESALQPRLQVMAERRITVENLLPDDLEAEVDGDLLGRVLENVLDNAIRHTPSGGRVVLAAERVGAGVALRIGNNGAPVPPEAKALIFEKFSQRLPGAGRHSFGLGLYFARLVAEAHAGRISVESEPGLPCVFVLELNTARTT